MSRQALPSQARRALVWVGLLTVSGCAFLPNTGPMVSDVEDGAAETNGFRFNLVPVTEEVVDTLASVPRRSGLGELRDERPDFLTLGPGDALQISLYQAGAGGPFSQGGPAMIGGGGSGSSGSGGASSAGLGGAPPAAAVSGVMVNEKGDITFPYAGVVHVAGLTIAETQAAILKRLQAQLVEPQIVVTLASNVSNLVTVTGAVKTPGRLPLTPGRETIVQLITEAGGPTNLTTDTVVEVTRHGHKAAASLEDLMEEPGRDVPAVPGDLVNLVLRQRLYTMFGATGKVAEYPIDEGGLTLAQGLARAGGTTDTQSDTKGVFLFRYEDTELVAKTQTPVPSATPGRVPVVYAFDLGHVPGYFLATRFPLRQNDLVFASDARLVQWQKALGLFGSVTAPAATGATLGR